MAQIEKSQSIIPQLLDQTTNLESSFINGNFVYHRRTELLWLLDVPNEKEDLRWLSVNNVYYLSIRNKSDGGNLDASYSC